MLMNNINLSAVLAAALSTLLLMRIWYSSAVFGTRRAKEMGIKPNTANAPHSLVYIGSFFLSLIAAGSLALLLQRKPGFFMALHTGILAGICWIATSFGINYLLSNRTFKLFLIDSGFHILQFTLYGIILGLWR